MILQTLWVRMALEADAMEEKERAGWIQRSQMRKEKRERSEERVKASEHLSGTFYIYLLLFYCQRSPRLDL